MDIFEAITKNDLEMIEQLLKEGENIEKEDEHKQTPLMIAAQQGNLEAVKLLIENRANIDAENLFKWTPLIKAVHYEHYEVVKLLLEKGADVHVLTVRALDWNALMYAFFKGSFKIAKLLLKVSKYEELILNDEILERCDERNYFPTLLLAQKHAPLVSKDAQRYLKETWRVDLKKY